MVDFVVSWARALAVAALSVAAVVAFSGGASAVDTNKYCKTGPDLTTNVDTGGLLSVDDVQLWTGTMQSASDCYGDFGNPNPSNEVAAINQIFGAISGPNQFIYLDKTDDPASSSGLGGIRFNVQAWGEQSGLWVVLWEDTNGALLQNAPLVLDLAVLLVGDNHSAAYLLSGLLLPFSPGGTFGTFELQLPAGNSLLNCGCDDDGHRHSYNSYDNKDWDDKDHCDPKPELSHLLIAGRLTPRQVPEPSTMALFGVGLLGMWMLRRRRSR